MLLFSRYGTKATGLCVRFAYDTSARSQPHVVAAHLGETSVFEFCNTSVGAQVAAVLRWTPAAEDLRFQVPSLAIWYVVEFGVQRNATMGLTHIRCAALRTQASTRACARADQHLSHALEGCGLYPRHSKRSASQVATPRCDVTTTCFVLGLRGRV